MSESAPSGSAQFYARFNQRMKHIEQKSGYTGTPGPHDVMWAMDTYRRSVTPGVQLLTPVVGPVPDQPPPNAHVSPALTQLRAEASPARGPSRQSSAEPACSHTPGTSTRGGTPAQNSLTPPARTLPSPPESARRSGRHRNPPISTTVTLLPSYKIPLPRDIDKSFQAWPIDVNGERGISLAYDGLLGGGTLDSGVAQNVDKARYDISHYFLDGTICVQRAYFTTDKTTGIFELKSVDVLGRSTIGHLLALLAQKQYKHWRSVADRGHVDLQALVGPSVVPPGNKFVPLSKIYIVAIRRRKSDKQNVWCYFPELEVRL